MKLHSNPIYPIGKPNTTISPPGEVITKTINDYPPELQQKWNSLTGYVKEKQIDTLAPQRRRYNPGQTRAHSWEKKGGEGA